MPKIGTFWIDNDTVSNNLAYEHDKDTNKNHWINAETCLPHRIIKSTIIASSHEVLEK